MSTQFRVEDVIVDLKKNIGAGDPELREDYIRCLFMYAGWVPDKGIILEIGCYRGDSTVALLAGSDPSVLVRTVDPIFKTGSLTYPDCNAGTVSLQSDIVAVEKRTLPYSEDGERLIIFPMTSRELLVDVKAYAVNSLIDFLYVDGEHTYEAVLEDCRWLDQVRSGGFAAFDDWMAPVEMAVRHYIANRREWRIVHESTRQRRGDMCVTFLKKF